MQVEKCPQCGSPLVARTEGGCLVLKCTQCALEAVTTDPQALISDETAYSVRLRPVKEITPRVSASLAVALGIRAQTARDLLRQGGPIATDVSAVEVQRLHGLLSPLGFSLDIKPHFRWALD